MKRFHKAKIDYSTIDYYKKFIKTSNIDINYELYRNVCLDTNTEIANKISTLGYCFKLPFGLGILEWRKYQRKIDLDDFEDSYKKLPVDRLATRKLWNEDKEYCEKYKPVVRWTNDETEKFVFKLIYFKSKSSFKNKGVYQMVVNQKLKRNAVQPIKDGKFDAFLNDYMYRRLKRKINEKCNIS